MKKLFSADQLADGQSKGCMIDGQAIFVVKKNEQFYGYINSCPHIGIELEFHQDQFLDEDAELIVCSSHGALFEIETGNCLAGPCIGQALESIELVIRQDSVYWDAS